MTDAIIADIDQDRALIQRKLVLKALSDPKRGSMTLSTLIDDIGKHDQYGPIVMSLTLAELRAIEGSPVQVVEKVEVSPKEETEPRSRRAPKKTRKVSAKTEKDAPATTKSPKGTRSRIDWEEAQEQIMTWMATEGSQVTTGGICKNCQVNGQNMTPVHARKALTLLIEAGKVSYSGEGRNTTYEIVRKKR